MIAIYLVCLFVFGYSLVLPKDNTPHPCDDRNCTINVTCGRRTDDPDMCICIQGYRGDECQDIDECNMGIHDPCGHRGNCTNTIGGYRCDCIQGWSDPTNHCSKNTTTNPGCMSGYFGINCTETRCDHGYAVYNTSLNYTYWCKCSRGWRNTRPQDSCNLDIDECNGKTNPCQQNENCTNTQGSYNCSCLLPWHGKDCDVYDVCKTVSCDYNNTVCVKTGKSDDRSYTCSCTEGWEGESCTRKMIQTTPDHENTVNTTVVSKAVQTIEETMSVTTVTPDHETTMETTSVTTPDHDTTMETTFVTTPDQETTVQTTFVTTPDQETTVQTTFVTTPDQETTMETTFVTTPDQETTMETTFVTTPDQETTMETTFVTTPDQETTMETTFVTTPDHDTTMETTFVTTPDQETTVETTFGTKPYQETTMETTSVITPDQETTMETTSVSKAVQTIEETLPVTTVTPDQETTNEILISTLIKGTNNEWTTHEDRVSESISLTDNTNRGGTGVPVIVGAVIGSVAVVTLVVVSSVLIYRYKKRVRVGIGDIQDKTRPQLLLRESGECDAKARRMSR